MIILASVRRLCRELEPRYHLGLECMRYDAKPIGKYVDEWHRPKNSKLWEAGRVMYFVNRRLKGWEPDPIMVEAWPNVLEMLNGYHRLLACDLVGDQFIPTDLIFCYPSGSETRWAAWLQEETNTKPG